MAMLSWRLIVAILWEFCVLLTVCETAKYNAEDFIQSTLTVKPNPTIPYPDEEQEGNIYKVVHQRNKRQADVEDDEDITNLPGVIASTFKNVITTQINGKPQVVTETRIQYFFPEQTFTGAAENPIEISGAITSSAVETYSEVHGDQTKFITSTFYTYYHTKGGNGGENAKDVSTEKLPGVITSSAISTFTQQRRGSTIQVTSTFYTYYYTQANGLDNNGGTIENGGSGSKESENGESNNGGGITKTFIGIPGAITSTFISSYSTVVGDITRFITETRLKYFLPENIEDKATEKMNIEGAITSSIISTYTKINAGKTRLLRSTFYTYYHTEAIVGNKEDEYYDENETEGDNANNGIESSGSSGGGSSGSSGGGSSGSSGGGSSGSSGSGSSGSNVGGSSGSSGSGSSGSSGAGSSGSNENEEGGSENEGKMSDMITSTFFSTVTKVINGKTRTLTQTKFLYYKENQISTETATEKLDLMGAITSSVVSSYTKFLNGVNRRVRSTFYTYYFTSDGSENEDVETLSKAVIPTTTDKKFPGAITSTIFTTYNTVISGKTRVVTETRLKYFIPDETLTQIETLKEINKNLITSTFFSTFTKTQNGNKKLVTSTRFEYYKIGAEMEMGEEIEIKPTKSNEKLSSEDMKGFITSTLLSTFTRTLNGKRRIFTKSKLVFYPITETVTEKVNRPMTIPGAISSSAISTFSLVEGGRTKIIKSTFYTYYFNEATHTEIFDKESENELSNLITSTFYSTFTKRIQGNTQMITSTFTSVYDDDYDNYDYPDELITSTFFKTFVRLRGSKTRTITSTITSVYEENIKPTSTLKIDNKFLTSTEISIYTEIISGKPKIVTSEILSFYDEEGNEILESQTTSRKIRKSHFIKPTTSIVVRVITAAVGESDEEDQFSSFSPIETINIGQRVRTSTSQSHPSIHIEDIDYPDEIETLSTSQPQDLIISKSTRIVTSPIVSSTIHSSSNIPKKMTNILEQKTTELTKISDSPTLEISGVKISTIFSTLTKVIDGTTKISTIVRTKYFPVTVTVDKPNNSEGKPRIKPTIAHPNYQTTSQVADNKHDMSKDVTSTIYSTYKSIIEGSTKYFTKTYVRHYHKSSETSKESENEDQGSDNENNDSQNENNNSQNENNDSQNKENNPQNEKGKNKNIITSTFIKKYKTRYGGNKDRLITSTIISTYNVNSESDYYDYGEDFDYGEEEYSQTDNKNVHTSKITMSNSISGKDSSTKYVSEEEENEDYKNSEVEAGVTSTFFQTYKKTYGKRTSYVTSTFISIYPSIDENQEGNKYGNKKEVAAANSEMKDDEENEDISKEITSTFYKTYYKQKGSQTQFMTSTFTSVYPLAGNSEDKNAKDEEYEYYDENDEITDSEESNKMFEKDNNAKTNTFIMSHKKKIHKITSTFYKTYYKQKGSQTQFMTSTFTSVYPLAGNSEDKNAKGEEYEYYDENDKITDSEESNKMFEKDNNAKTNTFIMSHNKKIHKITSTFYKTYYKQKGSQTEFKTSTFTSFYPIAGHSENKNAKEGEENKYSTNIMQQYEYYDENDERIGSEESEKMFENDNNLITSTFIMTHTRKIQGHTKIVTSTYTSVYKQTNKNKVNDNIEHEKGINEFPNKDETNGNKFNGVTSTFVKTYSKLTGKKTHLITSKITSLYSNKNDKDTQTIITESHKHKIKENFKDEEYEYYYDDDEHPLLTSTAISSIKEISQGKTRFVTSTFTSIYPVIEENSEYTGGKHFNFGNEGKLIIYTKIKGDFTKYITSSIPWVSPSDVSNKFKPHQHVESGEENDLDYQTGVTSTFIHEYPRVISGRTHYFTKTITSVFYNQIHHPDKKADDSNQKIEVDHGFGKQGIITSTFYNIYPSIIRAQTKYVTKTRLQYYPMKNSIDKVDINDDEISSTFTKDFTVINGGKTRHLTKTFVSYYPKEITNEIGIRPSQMIKNNIITSTFYSIYSILGDDSLEYSYQTEIVYYPKKGKPITKTLGKYDTEEYLDIDAVVSTFLVTHTDVIHGTTNLITSSWVSKYPLQKITDVSNPSTFIKKYLKPTNINKKQIKSTFTKFYTFTNSNEDYDDESDSFDGPVTTIYGIPGAITSTFYSTLTTIINGRTRYRTETRLLFYPTEGHFFNDKIEQTVASTFVSAYDVYEPNNNEYITSTLIHHNKIKQTHEQEITSTFFTTYKAVQGGKTKYSTETKMQTYSRSLPKVVQ